MIEYSLKLINDLESSEFVFDRSKKDLLGNVREFDEVEFIHEVKSDELGNYKFKRYTINVTDAYLMINEITPNNNLFNVVVLPYERLVYTAFLPESNGGTELHKLLIDLDTKSITSIERLNFDIEAKCSKKFLIPDRVVKHTFNQEHVSEMLKMTNDRLRIYNNLLAKLSCSVEDFFK